MNNNNIDNNDNNIKTTMHFEMVVRLVVANLCKLRFLCFRKK